MGQSKWAGACALLAVVGFVVSVGGEEVAQNPFGADAPAADPNATPAEKPAAAKEPAHTREFAERRIEFILDQPLTSPLDYPETPLNTIASIISEEFDIPIKFDTKALEAIAVSPDVEVTVSLQNVTLRSALDLMLGQVEDLTYIVDKEVLLITTEDEANKRLEVRVYRVDDLVREDGAKSQPIDEDRFDALHDIIVSTVEHDSWTENGTGEGEILNFAPGMFVIGQTHRVHEQINELLAEIREVKGAIEAQAPGESVSPRPVTRGFKIVSSDFTGTPESRTALHNAIQRSTAWATAGTELDDEDVFLEVLPHRVIVRHLPHIVREVERSLVTWGAMNDKKVAAKPRGGLGGGGGRGGF
jgi:hypothetical protein